MRTVRFYVLSRTCGKPPFLRKTSSPAVSFVSFLQEKKSFPLLFFVEEKPVGMRGKRRPSDGRTQAHPALSSVGIPQRVCLPPPPCLCPCPPRLRACASRANRPRKRKSSADHAFVLFKAVYAILQHKTDGSYVNRPFFMLQAECAGKHLFSDKSSIPQCLLFLFFKKRKRPPFKKTSL